MNESFCDGLTFSRFLSKIQSFYASKVGGGEVWISFTLLLVFLQGCKGWAPSRSIFLWSYIVGIVRTPVFFHGIAKN